MSAVSAAVAVVTDRGYTPLDTNDYMQSAPGGLHVIIAKKTGSAGSHEQRAFFFARDRFVRMDLATPSAAIKLAWRNAATIALSYGVYKPTDGVCCPSGGSMIVRYHWNGAHVLVLDPVPPTAARR